MLAQLQDHRESGGHEREHSAQVHPAAGGAGTALHRVHRSGDSYRAETKRKSALHPPARSGVDRSASESCGDAGQSWQPVGRCVRLIRDLGDEVPSPHTKPEIPLWKANCNKDHRGCRRPMPTFGWGKYSVRLYVGRTRRGRAPAPLVDTSSVSFPLPPAAGPTHYAVSPLQTRPAALGSRLGTGEPKGETCRRKKQPSSPQG